MENFIPAAAQSNKATIHLEGKMGVQDQVQMRMCACTRARVCMHVMKHGLHDVIAVNTHTAN